jgi:phosphoribosylaminoimidazole-succinocarboxamide synthase
MEKTNAVRDLPIEKLAASGIKAAGDPGRLYKGKVRDTIDLGDKLFIYTTDRISAFDRVLAAIPYKGEILNRISLFWFKQTEDIVQNHIIKEITPRSVLVRKCSILPVEVIVRGYLTGSAYRDYLKGNPLSGIRLKSGMKKNEKFPEPLITPSTKAEKGVHDEPISREEILSRRIVPQETWEQIEAAALGLFKRGTEVAAKRGLILVDTKYEFGFSDNRLYVADEIHTQDSSRYWHKDTYDELFAKDEDQRELDKEYFRKWLMARGYMGDGTPPEIDEKIKTEISDRYKEAFRIITGEEFIPSALNEDEELKRIVAALKAV